jgi:quercetin dioxygenase-like cupin family protein
MSESPWPDSLDAMVAAPRHHKLVYENDQIRILDTRIPAGDIVPVHTHRWPAVYYAVSPGDFIRRDGEGNVLLDTRITPRQPGQSPLSEPLTPHSVENVSASEIRLVSVEMKDLQPSRPS